MNYDKQNAIECLERAKQAVKDNDAGTAFDYMAFARMSIMKMGTLGPSGQLQENKGNANGLHELYNRNPRA